MGGTTHNGRVRGTNRERRKRSISKHLWREADFTVYLSGRIDYTHRFVPRWSGNECEVVTLVLGRIQSLWPLRSSLLIWFFGRFQSLWLLRCRLFLRFFCRIQSLWFLQSSFLLLWFVGRTHWIGACDFCNVATFSDSAEVGSEGWTVFVRYSGWVPAALFLASPARLSEWHKWQILTDWGRVLAFMGGFPFAVFFWYLAYWACRALKGLEWLLGAVGGESVLSS